MPSAGLRHSAADVALRAAELQSRLVLGKRLLLLNMGRAELWERDGCQKFKVVSQRRRDSVEEGELSCHHKLGVAHRRAGLACPTP